MSSWRQAVCCLFRISPNKVIGQQTRDLIDKPLLARLSLAGVTRVTGVSEQWLTAYVNAKYEVAPRQVEVEEKKRGGSQFKAMRCGRLSVTKVINNGCG